MDHQIYFTSIGGDIMHDSKLMADELESICKAQYTCETCPIEKFCDDTDHWDESDKLEEAYEYIHPELKEDAASTESNDAVNHPSHYCQGSMECIDEMVLVFGKEAVKNFCLCNVWKYRKRALLKNGQQDLDKSDWYMNKYKELSESV